MNLVKVVKTNYFWELSTLLCNVSISTLISLACQHCNWSSECNAKLIKKWINFNAEAIRKFHKCFRQHLILYVRLWCVLFLCYLFVDYLSTWIIDNEFYSLTICSSNYLIKFWHCTEILFVVIWDHILEIHWKTLLTHAHRHFRCWCYSESDFRHLSLRVSLQNSCCLSGNKRQRLSCYRGSVCVCVCLLFGACFKLELIRNSTGEPGTKMFVFLKRVILRSHVTCLALTYSSCSLPSSLVWCFMCMVKGQRQGQGQE